MKGRTDDPMVPFHRVTRQDRGPIGRRFALSSRLVLLMSPLSLPTRLQGMAVMDSAALGQPSVRTTIVDHLRQRRQLDFQTSDGLCQLCIPVPI
jgi:hypothetical protein